VVQKTEAKTEWLEIAVYGLARCRVVDNEEKTVEYRKDTKKEIEFIEIDTRYKRKKQFGRKKGKKGRGEGKKTNRIGAGICFEGHKKGGKREEIKVKDNKLQIEQNKDREKDREKKKKTRDKEQDKER
jgi:hypothetical protein